MPLTALRIVYLSNAWRTVRDVRKLHDLAMQLRRQPNDDTATGNEIITTVCCRVNGDDKRFSRRAVA